MEPRYRDVRREQIPEVSLEGGAKVKIICGEVNGVRGPVHDIVIEPEYLDVTVPAPANFTHPIKRGHTTFAYVIEGKGYFDDEQDAFAHEVVGKNYFDLDRQCICGNGSLIFYGDGGMADRASPGMATTWTPTPTTSRRSSKRST
jgi:quercetin 2,3-dioxygenase